MTTTFPPTAGPPESLDTAGTARPPQATVETVHASSARPLAAAGTSVGVREMPSTVRPPSPAGTLPADTAQAPSPAGTLPADTAQAPAPAEGPHAHTAQPPTPAVSPHVATAPTLDPVDAHHARVDLLPAQRRGPDTAPPPVGVEPAVVVRFAVLGDSLSEGVGDRVDGAWRGWAALLADGLGGPAQRVEFRNLALSGAQSQEVAEQQAPAAVAFRPDLASVVVGVNDTLRHTFDIARLARRLDRVCADLSASGAVLLTACLPDPGRMLGLPAPLARPLARRQKAVNALVHAVSDRYDAVHLHLADAQWTDDRSLWSADRLHPGERGHRAIAARFHSLLAARGLAHGTPPSPEPEQPPPTRAEAALWLATAGTGWVVRRCHDLLPQLLHLAGSELRHWAGGTGARLDRRAEHALSAALAAVSLDVPVATMGE
ncbi:GDSL-type esterase/lipase family protein [Streptomyces sp. NPDC059567]|uniref:GDSL-type esterase/lipase family protein n=1 Tax=Streptomyces sp. NPDC059567 TaxID=3346867 RepID=UPI003674D61E